MLQMWRRTINVIYIYMGLESCMNGPNFSQISAATKANMQMLKKDTIQLLK